MEKSPIERVLETIDARDESATLAQFADDARVLAVDGRQPQGRSAVRDLVRSFFDMVRSSSHRVTAQWQIDDVWIAEVDATYELNDFLELKGLARAIILRHASEGIAELRFYGAREKPLDDHPTGEEGLWVGGRWVPPL